MLNVIFLTMVLAGWLAVGQALAASPCPLSFLDGSPVSSIDGVRDGEWDDAMLIESGSACLEQLIDSDTTPRDVRIYSKSFLSGSDRVLALFFEVEDQSNSFPLGFTEGERIVVQLDPDFSGGTQITGSDFLFDFRHIWQAVSGSPDEIQVSLDVYDGSGPSGFCTLPQWQAVTSTPSISRVARLMRDASSMVIGYTFEVLIPESVIGSMGANLGIAIGIVNDWADCTQTGICDDHGTGFPSSLPMTNTDNPLPNVGCGLSWNVPDDWATGYFDHAPGDVLISHNPKFWRSEDVDGLACEETTENRYFPGTPCRLRARSRIHNSSTTEQVRNLLYLFGVYGIGGTQWNFIELQQGVTVPATGDRETTSIFADNTVVAAVGAETNAHPCVRVYILPPSISSDFDLADMEAINDVADLDALVAAYGLESQHSAQQNISRQAAGSNCPQSNCNAVGSLLDSNLPLFADASGHVTGSYLDLSRQSNQPPLLLARNDNDSQSTIAAAAIDRDPIGGGIRPPDLTDTRGLEQYLRSDVIVEVVGMAYREPSDGPYNFIETVGGILHLTPVNLLDPQQGVNFTFQVTNPSDVARTIWLVPRIHTPPGYEDVKLQIDTARRVYGPGETRTLSARIVPPGGATSPMAGDWSFSAHLGINDPRGSLGNVTDSGVGAGLDLSYNLSRTLALEAYLGRERFEGQTALPDIDIDMLTLSLRGYADIGVVNLFGGVGVGQYWLDPGDDGFGVTASAGVQVPVRPNLLIEGTLRYHNVDAAGDPKFMQYQLGIRVPF
jgi:hypothetical protein